MSEITVIARATAKPGKEDALLAALRAAVAPTHGEPGCLKYIVHRSLENPAAVAVVERWTSKAALDAHLQTAHIKTLFSQVPALAAGLPEITVYESVAEGSSLKGRFQ